MVNNYQKLTADILLCTRQFTDITPGVYFRKGSKNVLVVFETLITDKEIVSNIKSALGKFGQVLPNAQKTPKFLSFLIIRN